MEVEVDLSEHSYAIAVPCYEGKIQAETALSLVQLSGNLTAQGIKHCFLMIRGGALIDAVRNELTERFLHQTECDTMICVDADIEFTWEGFQRLAVFSHHYPIVAGAYPGRIDPPKFIVNYKGNELNEHGLLPINGTGFGFVAIQRKVFEGMKPDTYEVEGQEPRKAFFRTTLENGRYIGEDVYFFRRAEEAGFEAFIDPGIDLIHHGSKAYDYKFRDAIHQILGDKNGIQTG